MLADRNQENANFKKALKDDVDAVALLEQAIAAITKFYTENKIPLEFAQEPEYTVDEDKAPDATFSSSGSSKSETTGLIAILSMLKEDLEKEIAVARKEEGEAQAEYEKLNGEATEAVEALKQKETALKAEEAELEGKIADTEGEIDGHKEVAENTEKEKETLAISCDWVKETFDSRREKRKAEIAGLEEAKALLAGARPEFLQGNFLERMQ